MATPPASPIQNGKRHFSSELPAPTTDELKQSSTVYR
jgi:hypothetical protein